jgi:hypothetical protein
MLGKIFKKKEDEFFMAIPEGAGAVETPVEFAPAITEEKKSTAKTKKVETKEAIATVSTAPAATVSSTDSSSIIAAALNSYTAAAAEGSEAVSFAENYLVQAGNSVSRRRPSVNMGEFMGMAKNVRR